MRINKVNAVVRRLHNYQADDAIAQWYKEKTKSSVSEAFKDADYATALWRCETDWDKAKEYAGWVVMWAFTLFLLYSLACWFERAVK